jgi:C_GCAxxG_C_C family probable redox protein
MENRAELAIARFDQGFNCAQAVFSAYSEALGLSEESALKVTGGFGGGMGYIGETCGAVTGAVMAIGLKFGKYRPDDAAAKDKTYALVQRFNAEFKKRYGSVRCNDLTGYDLALPGELAEARASGVFAAVCPGLVRAAAEIVAELLGD